MFSSFFGIVAGVLIAIFVVPLLIGLLLGKMSWSTRPPVEPNSVLHILLDGEIVDSAPTMDWIFDDGLPKTRLQKMIKAIRNARDDARITGVVLDIRSPSIGWSSATALRREILAFKESKKFVFAYADRLNEMGFYLASSAEKTYMQPYGDVELDGIASENPFLKGLFAKLEVKPVIFRVGKFKAAVEPFLLEKMSPENREQTSVLLQDIWGEARKGISERAGLKTEQLDQWMSALSVSSVSEAKKAGLITDVMFTDEFDVLMRKTAGWPAEGDTKYVSISQMAGESKKKSGEKRRIALLIAEGEIVKGEGGRGQIGDDTYMQALYEIADDPDVAAVVVRINSPGGDALASDILWRELTVMDEKRPVVASMGDVAASGGYYMAVGARHILAESTTITGSIGVFGLMFNAQDLFKNKMGVVFDRVATHDHSDYGSFTRPLDEKESATIQTSVERTYKRFVDVVAQSRRFEKIEDVEALAEGRVWSGSRALELGLVDELGGLDRALAKAAELAGLGDGYEIDMYPRKIDQFSKFIEQLTEGSETEGRSAKAASWLGATLKHVASAINDSAKALSVNPWVDVVSLARPLESELRLIERVRESGRPAVLAREPLSSKSIR